jgi:hypothetical protein
MKSYVELAGIGPWAVFQFGPPDVTDVMIHGKPAAYEALVAIAWTGPQMWEIIQPVSGHSIYDEFLDEVGEGMHHVLPQHAGRDFDDVIARFAARDCPVMMSLTFRGSRFAFIDTRRELKLITEIFQRPPTIGQPTGKPATRPAYWYPYDPESLPKS